jgi:hypothetical protein
MFRNSSRPTFGALAAASLLCDLKNLMRVLAIPLGTLASSRNSAPDVYKHILMLQCGSVIRERRSMYIDQLGISPDLTWSVR